MTHRPAPVPQGAASAPAIEARLELDPIGVAQNPVIGLASCAPAETMAIPRSAFFQTLRGSAWGQR